MLERLIQEVRGREKIIRTFSSKDSVWPLVGVLLLSTSRCYLKADEFYNWLDKRVESPWTSNLEPQIALFDLSNWRRASKNLTKPDFNGSRIYSYWGLRQLSCVKMPVA